MKTLTHTQLREVLKSTKGNMFVGLLACVDTRCHKTGNPFALPVFKQLRVVGTVGADYQTSVNNEALRQGAAPEFEAESLPWGQWDVYGKVISHNEKLYLRTQTTPGQRRKAPARVLNYRDANGKFVARDILVPFLPVEKESDKQQLQTGIKKTVWVRTYAFDSIQKIRIAGQTFQLVP